MNYLDKTLCLVRWILLIISQDAKKITGSNHLEARNLFQELDSFLCSEDELEQIFEEVESSSEAIQIQGDFESLSAEEIVELGNILSDLRNNENNNPINSIKNYQLLSPQLLNLLRRVVQYLLSVKYNEALERLISCNKKQALETSVECAEDAEIYNLWQSFNLTISIVQRLVVQNLFATLDFFLGIEIDFAESALHLSVDQIMDLLLESELAKIKLELEKILPEAIRSIQEIARRHAQDSDFSVDFGSNGEYSANDIANLLESEVRLLTNLC